MSPWLVNGSASLERPSTNGKDVSTRLTSNALPSSIIPAALITVLDPLKEAFADGSWSYAERLASAPCASFSCSETMA